MKLGQLAFVIFFATATLAYDAENRNVYLLFTRLNPTTSQQLVTGDTSLLKESNFNPDRTTVFLIHGWRGTATTDINTALVPAYLQATDANVIVVDWSEGAHLLSGGDGKKNIVPSGQSVARLIDWLVEAAGLPMERVQVVGHSLGAHQAAVVGRSVTRGTIPYIVALDPGANMERSGNMFGPDVATYTEAIHTNAVLMGHGEPVAHVDFFPNGGTSMPGCLLSPICDHIRSIYYFAETLTSRGFIGTSCESLREARRGNCSGASTLTMGGLTPKTGHTGIYFTKTNSRPPYSTA